MDVLTESQLKAITERLLSVSDTTNGNNNQFPPATDMDMKTPIPESMEIPEDHESKVKWIPNPINIPTKWLYFSEYGNFGLNQKALDKVSKAFLNATKGSMATDNKWPKNMERAKVEDFENAFNFVTIASRNASLEPDEQIPGALMFLRNFAELRTNNRNYAVEECIHWALRTGPNEFREVRDWFIRRNHEGEIRERRNEYRDLKIRANQNLQHFMEVAYQLRLKLPMEDRGTFDELFGKIETARSEHKWDSFEATLLQSISTRRENKQSRGKTLDETDWQEVYRAARANNKQSTVYNRGNQKTTPNKEGQQNRKRKNLSDSEKPDKKQKKENGLFCEYKFHGWNNTHETKDCRALQRLKDRKNQGNKSTVAATNTGPTVATLQDAIDDAAEKSD